MNIVEKILLTIAIAELIWFTGKRMTELELSGKLVKSAFFMIFQMILLCGLATVFFDKDNVDMKTHKCPKQEKYVKVTETFYRKAN